MINDIETKAEGICKPIIENLGYELVETTFRDLYGNPTLTFYIYKKGGISLNDCEIVTNAINDVLDEADITRGEFYHLNVSSLGLDRLIITEDDFRRNLDEDIELIFAKKIGKMKRTHGKLIAYDESKITILEKNKKVSYDRLNIETVRPYIDFK